MAKPDKRRIVLIRISINFLMFYYANPTTKVNLAKWHSKWIHNRHINFFHTSNQETNEYLPNTNWGLCVTSWTPWTPTVLAVSFGNAEYPWNSGATPIFRWKSTRWSIRADSVFEHNCAWKIQVINKRLEPPLPWELFSVTSVPNLTGRIYCRKVIIISHYILRLMIWLEGTVSTLFILLRRVQCWKRCVLEYVQLIVNKSWPLSQFVQVGQSVWPINNCTLVSGGSLDDPKYFVPIWSFSKTVLVSVPVRFSPNLLDISNCLTWRSLMALRTICALDNLIALIAQVLFPSFMSL